MLDRTRWIHARAALPTALLLGSWAALAPRAEAQPLTILRYEPLAALVAGEPTARSSSEGAGPRLSFTAFGTRFAMTLRRNDVLTRNLPADVLRRLESTELYVGTLDGVEGSWVRLARIDGALSGAIFDGTELYAIEPFERIAAHMVAGPELDATEPVIYRWSDTASAATDGVVFPLRAPTRVASEKTGALQSLYRELAALPPVVGATKMLDIGLLADSEFVQMHGTRAEEFMLAIANTVDGVFAKQVGVRIRVTELHAYGSEPDAFSGTDASALLAQLGSFKVATPALRQKGLVHLLTGRNLDEQPGMPSGSRLLGMANFGSLCHERYAVSLTQYMDHVTTSLMAAHEIAHNFGAPHDAETGSPCESADEGYLMTPFYSGNWSFSACSVQQMAVEIAAASCLVPNPSLVLERAVVSRDVIRPGEPVDIDWTVVNQAPVAASDVRATFEVRSDLEFLAMDSATGAVCAEDASEARRWSCPVGTVGVGATLALKLRLRAFDWVAPQLGGAGVGAISLTLVPTEPEFDYPASWSVGPNPYITRNFSDLYSELTAPAAAPVGSTFTMTVHGGNRGPDAVTEILYRIYTPTRRGLMFESATSSRGTCSNPSGEEIRCEIGTLASEDTFAITVQATAAPGGEHDVEGIVFSPRTFEIDNRNNISGRPFFAGTPPAPSPPPAGSNPVPPPPPPPAAPPPSAAPSGGGGGSGAIDAWLLLALLGVASYRRNRAARSNV